MTNETANPVLDLAQVADLMALDQGIGAVYARFVDLFVKGTGARITAIRQHADSGDAAGLAQAVHALRGASGNVGAVRLAGLLERIEQAAKARDVAAASEWVVLLDAEYALTCAALLELRSRTAAGRTSS